MLKRKSSPIGIRNILEGLVVLMLIAIAILSLLGPKTVKCLSGI